MHLLVVCLEGGQVDTITIQDVGQLLLGVDGHEGGDERARSRTGDDARQEPAEEQGLDDAEVAEAEDGAALQDEGAPAEGLARVVQEVELALRRERVVHVLRVDVVVVVHLQRRGRRARVDVLDGARHLRRVLLHQVLGARERAVVEPRRGDVAQVPHESGAD